MNTGSSDRIIHFDSNKKNCCDVGQKWTYNSDYHCFNWTDNSTGSWKKWKRCKKSVDDSSDGSAVDFGLRDPEFEPSWFLWESETKSKPYFLLRHVMINSHGHVGLMRIRKSLHQQWMYASTTFVSTLTHLGRMEYASQLCLLMCGWH